MNKPRFANGWYRRFVWVVAMVLLLLVVPKPSSAQIMGTILGTVKDSSGGVVPQAKVTLVNTDTSDTRTATTGDDGSFRFPALVAGHYTVGVEREGFKTETQTGLTLEVAQEMVMNTVLQVGTSTQEVTVTGEAPVVNTTNSSLGGLVNENKMTDLPLNGRNYADLTFMQPGVNITANVGSSNQQGGAKGSFFTSDGASDRQNMSTLDGANTLNMFGGTSSGESGTTLGVAGIKEFKVVTGVFDASYGLAPGAQIVMVSKGGSNQFHGELFEYLRNSEMDAANFFDHPVAANNYERLPEFQRNNFGAAGGGPIKKDKTFFYAAYEGLRQRFGQTIDDTVPGAGCHGPTGNNTGVVTNTACPQLGSSVASVTIAPVMQQILTLYPTPNLPSNQYTFPTDSPSEVNWGQIRVDENISASDTLFGRYTSDKDYTNTTTSSVNTASAGVGFPQFLFAYASYNQSATISENHIFSPTVLNQFRFSYSRIHWNEYNLYPDGTAVVSGPGLSFIAGEPFGNISLSGFTSMGVAVNNPQGGEGNIYVLADDLYYTKGKHALRFGTEVNRYNINLLSVLKYEQGQITFSSLANFLQGLPVNYASIQNGVNANGNRDWWYWVPGFYAQDDWRVSPRLTLNLGLRYEFESDPTESNGRSYAIRNRITDAAFTQGPPFAGFGKLHFSPRVGFAWDVQGNGKTSVRSGFGRYYDIGNLANTFSQGMGDLPPLCGELIQNDTTNTPITMPWTFFPATEQVAAIPQDYYTKNPYLLKWNLTVERQLPLGIGLQVAYVGTRGVHLYQDVEGNVNLPTAIVNGLPYWNGTEPRENPNFGSFQLLATTANSHYNALEVAMNKRLSQGVEFQVSYTYSKDLDNVEGDNGNGGCSAASGMTQGDYYGPGNSVFLKGPSCGDITHNMRVNILYHIPNIKSDNFAAKLEHGWWAGAIWSAQTGYAFTPVLGTNRSQSQILKSSADFPNIATAADAANCPAVSATCAFVPVAFNPSTVIEGNPAQWYNPKMFTLAPMVTAPGSTTVCTSGTCGAGTTYGTLGNVSHGLLRGPGLDNLDFSINKDTRLPFLGEQGNLEFRAEIFNILNHPNFAMPNGTVFSGSTTAYGPYSQAPSGSAGAITQTTGTARQIQLALKIVF